MLVPPVKVLLFASGESTRFAVSVSVPVPNLFKAVVCVPPATLSTMRPVQLEAPPPLMVSAAAEVVLLLPTTPPELFTALFNEPTPNVVPFKSRVAPRLTFTPELMPSKLVPGPTCSVPSCTASPRFCVAPTTPALPVNASVPGPNLVNPFASTVPESVVVPPT